MGSVGAWIRAWRGSNFSVGDVGGVGLKNFGVSSVDGVSPNILAWVTWVKYLAWVVWVPLNIGPGSKYGLVKKTMRFKCLAI